MSKTKSNGSNGHVRAPQAESEQRECVCKLNEAEMLARGDQMASCENEILAIKSTRRGLTGQINDLAEQRAKLAKVIELGAESRMVECKWIEEIKQNCFKLIRQDTGEQNDTRPMSGGDRQVGLGFEGDDIGEGDNVIGEDEIGEIFVSDAETADTQPPAKRKRTTTPPAAKSKAKAKPKPKGKAKGHTRHAHA